jgi:hypothetical protein
MHSAAAAHGFAAYDTMRRAEAYRHPLEAQDPLALQHTLAVQNSNNDHQVGLANKLT